MTTTAIRQRLIYRLGYAGFMFFLVKGLLWLVAPFVFLWFV